MGKAKYSKLATDDYGEEPLPVRTNGRGVLGEVLHTASTDGTVPKAFRAPERTIWTEFYEGAAGQALPSCSVNNNRPPWLCVVEWLQWAAAVSLPLLKVYVMFMIVGFLLTLDCTSTHPKHPKMNCRDGFVWRLALVGSVIVVVFQLARLACQHQPAGASDQPQAGQQQGGPPRLRTMQAVSSP